MELWGHEPDHSLTRSCKELPEPYRGKSCLRQPAAGRDSRIVGSQWGGKDHYLLYGGWTDQTRLGQRVSGQRGYTKMPMYKRAQMGIGYLPQEASVFRKLS